VLDEVLGGVGGVESSILRNPDFDLSARYRPLRSGKRRNDKLDHIEIYRDGWLVIGGHLPYKRVESSRARVGAIVIKFVRLAVFFSYRPRSKRDIQSPRKNDKKEGKREREREGAGGGHEKARRRQRNETKGSLVVATRDASGTSAARCGAVRCGGERT